MTIVVDVANVMGSRPDGWWRDRPGAALRLHAEITRLAKSGRSLLPPAPNDPAPNDPAPGDPAPGDPAPGDPAPGDPAANGLAPAPGFVMVLEGAARAAAARLTAAADPDADADGTGPVRRGEVRVVQARGSGDDTIVAVVRELPGRRVVVTADRELRARCVAAGAEARDRQRKATERASGALTSVMPTIHDIDIRHVDEPAKPPRPDVAPPGPPLLP